MLKNYLLKLKLRIENWYLLYELNTQLSICEPWEKIFINCLFLTVLVTVSYACCAYLPGYVSTFLYFVTPAGFVDISKSDPSGADSAAYIANQGADFIKNI